jgi:cytochrome c
MRTKSHRRPHFHWPTLLFVLGVMLLPLPVTANGTVSGAGDPDYQPMIDLAWKSRCFNCHDVQDEVRGPAWVEVARRYRGDDEAFELLVERVRDGSSGNWGDDRMSPNRRVAEEDIRALVKWLLTLE